MSEPIEAGLMVVSADGFLIGTLRDRRDGMLAVQTGHLVSEIAYIPEDQVADVRGGEVLLRGSFAAVSALATVTPPGVSPAGQPTTDWAGDEHPKELESE